MEIRLEDHLNSVVIPTNLTINKQINQFRRYCKEHGCTRPYHHFAFGQSPFPPPQPIIEALAANAQKHSYLPIAGIPELRELISEFYRRKFDLDCEKDRIVISPGSKEMISMILAVVQGVIVIPAPAWVSYLPQAKILKKEVLSLRTRPEDGHRLTPDLLEHGLSHIHAAQRILILNHPCNPTGTVYTEDELQELAKICRKYNVIVISDEIYALTSFEVDRFVSMMKVYPEGTIVTGGLSKDRSCGGYRLGVGIFPAEARDLVTSVLKVAGATYSCVAGPIQYAAMAAYADDPQVDDHVRDCRDINALVGTKMTSLIAGIEGVTTTTPQGGFYLYVDFNDRREEFLKLGMDTCTRFCKHLLAVEHTALLPASSLLLSEDDFSVRCSFVDYDGSEALSAWRRIRPGSAGEREQFFRGHCGLLSDGVRYIKRYIDQIREGRKPEHQ